MTYGGKLLTIPSLPITLDSQFDEAGISTTLTTSSLTDSSKYWTAGIWIDALLVMTINGQNYTTIVSTNSTNTVQFPTLPFTINSAFIANVPYGLKRLQPTLARPGISLTATQQLLVFSVIPTDVFTSTIPWITGLLGAGGSTHLYNSSMAPYTVTPYAIAQGYSLSVVEIQANGNQNLEIWMFLDSGISGCITLGAFNSIDQTPLIPYSTAILDPAGTSSHTFDVAIFNRGLSPFRGSVNIVTILQKI